MDDTFHFLLSSVKFVFYDLHHCFIIMAELRRQSNHFYLDLYWINYYRYFRLEMDVICISFCAPLPGEFHLSSGLTISFVD